MNRDECSVGMAVVYRPHPGADAEDGLVVERRDGGAMVRYGGPHAVAKFTRYADLSPIGGAR